MKTLTFSDSHIWKNSDPGKIKCLIDYVEFYKPDILICNGDIDDPWKSSWEHVLESRAHRELQCLVSRLVSSGKRVVILRRNHDWNAKKCYLQGAELVRRFRVENTEWRHGDEFAMDWSIIGPGVFWLSSRFPQVTVPIYHLLYRTPGQLKSDEETWNWGVGMINLRAEAYARKHKINLIFGHTHLPLVLNLGKNQYLVNSGDLEDSMTVIEWETYQAPRLVYL